MGCISTHTARLGGTLKAGTARLGGTLRISVSQVCTVDISGPYVRASPECVWLTDDDLREAYVAVESNRTWTAG